MSFMRAQGWFVAVALAALLPRVAAGESEEATVRSAKQVLDEFTNLQIQQIPAAMLQDVHGVAIFPDVIKIGLVVGGRHGRGVVLLREADGAWRAPTFVSLTGGSIGWQVGAQATDLVLVFKTAKSVEGLLRGKFTLGADAAVAAGPLGRRAEAATDAQLKAEIYSYSRSRGLFAGVSLDGAGLQINDEATRRFYGAAGSPVPESALALMQSVASLTGGGKPATPTPAGPVLAPPAAAASSAATVEVLRSDVAEAARQLAPLLDSTWQAYLALPAEIYSANGQPPAGSLAAAVQRLDAVAADARYAALASRPEFRTLRDRLKAYEAAQRGLASGPALALPPPPSAPR